MSTFVDHFKVTVVWIVTNVLSYGGVRGDIILAPIWVVAGGNEDTNVSTVLRPGRFQSLDKLIECPCFALGWYGYSTTTVGDLH